MQRREFTHAGRTYLLVARGESSNLDRALSLVQQLVETADTPTLGGIIEVADCTVTIEHH